MEKSHLTSRLSVRAKDSPFGADLTEVEGLPRPAELLLTAAELQELGTIVGRGEATEVSRAVSIPQARHGEWNEYAYRPLPIRN